MEREAIRASTGISEFLRFGISITNAYEEKKDAIVIWKSENPQKWVRPNYK